MRRAVALAGHGFTWPELLALTRRAEVLGYEAVVIDGDVSVRDQAVAGDLLDGASVHTALLAATERIRIGSIRLVHHWNAARLAQWASTQEALAPGRSWFLLGIGDHANDRRFGLPLPPKAERVQWLEETVAACRALWRGEEVSCEGRFVRLERARVRPAPPDGRIPICVAAAAPALLDVVARRADAWDLNLPALPAPVDRAVRALEAACAAAGRDPAEIERSMWIVTRPDRDPEDPGLASAFRRAQPWFGSLSDDAARRAVVAGDALSCDAEIDARAERLGLDLPVLDASGLSHDAVQHLLESCAPSENPR